MFTIEEIQEIEQHSQGGKGFPQLAKGLAKLGVVRTDVFVINGMTTYFGEGDETVQGPPIYEDLLIEEESSILALQEALKIHQNGASDYQTFCRELAVAGVEKWVVDLTEMTISYFDMAGKELITEKILG